jgi:hypothetical protein
VALRGRYVNAHYFHILTKRIQGQFAERRSYNPWTTLGGTKDPTEVLRLWEAQLKTLYSQPEVADELGSISQDQVDRYSTVCVAANLRHHNVHASMNRPISEGEIAVARMRLNRLSKGARIPPASVRHDSSDASNLSDAVLLNYIFEGDVPSDFWRLSGQPLHKRHGSAEDINDYRILAFPSPEAALIDNVVLRRISTFVESRGLLGTEQAGFRRGRSTAGPVLQGRVLMELCATARIPLIVLYVDVQRAYGSVLHQVLLTRLWELGIRGKVWHYIKRRLEATTIRIQTGAGRTEDVALLRGLAEGLALSPFLFDLYIEILIAESRGSRVNFSLPLDITVDGVQRTVRIHVSGYADDLRFYIHDFDAIEPLMRMLETVGQRLGFRYKTGPTKTAWMPVFPAELPPEVVARFVLQGQVVPCVSEYRYLGIIEPQLDYDALAAALLPKLKMATINIRQTMPRRHSILVNRTTFLSSMTAALEYCVEARVPYGNFPTPILDEWYGALRLTLRLPFAYNIVPKVVLRTTLGIVTPMARARIMLLRRLASYLVLPATDPVRTAIYAHVEYYEDHREDSDENLGNWWWHDARRALKELHDETDEVVGEPVPNIVDRILTALGRNHLANRPLSKLLKDSAHAWVNTWQGVKDRQKIASLVSLVPMREYVWEPPLFPWCTSTTYVQLRVRLRGGLRSALHNREMSLPRHRCIHCQANTICTVPHLLRDCPRLAAHRRAVFSAIFHDPRTQSLHPSQIDHGAMRDPCDGTAESSEWWFRATLGGPFQTEQFEQDDGTVVEQIPRIWSRKMPRRCKANRTQLSLLDARNVILSLTGKYALALVNQHLERLGVRVLNRYL